MEVTRWRVPPLAALVILALALVAAYWSTFEMLARRWYREPEYSHGFLVPVAAAALMWVRRDKLVGLSAKGSAWGLALLCLGTAIRLGSRVTYYFLPDPASFIICLAGLCLLVAGYSVSRVLWSSIAFLAFMIPLPGQWRETLALPLQRIATVASTYVVQTLGLPAFAEGNVIVLNSDVRIGVAEACNGLPMLMVFVATCAAIAILLERPLWKRVVVLASAIPIAIVSNVIRIAITAVLHLAVSSEFAEAFFHDFAGWLMVPLAMGILGLELTLFSFVLRRPSGAPSAGAVPKLAASHTGPPVTVKRSASGASGYAAARPRR
jgi:exosortase